MRKEEEQGGVKWHLSIGFSRELPRKGGGKKGLGRPHLALGPAGWGEGQFRREGNEDFKGEPKSQRKKTEREEGLDTVGNPQKKVKKAGGKGGGGGLQQQQARCAKESSLINSFDKRNEVNACSKTVH